jgi:uncharacterized membrane protein YGL010W
LLQNAGMIQTASLSVNLRKHIAEYEESHRTLANKLLHFGGIPALLISILGLFSKLALFVPDWPGMVQPSAAWIALLVALVWYFAQDLKAGAIMTPIWVGGYLIGALLPVVYLAILFGVGVLAHVIGHYVFEHKPPAVLSHPASLFEAPLWLVVLATAMGRPSV